MPLVSCPDADLSQDTPGGITSPMPRRRSSATRGVGMVPMSLVGSGPSGGVAPPPPNRRSPAGAGRVVTPGVAGRASPGLASPLSRGPSPAVSIASPAGDAGGYGDCRSYRMVRRKKKGRPVRDKRKGVKPINVIARFRSGYNTSAATFVEASVQNEVNIKQRGSGMDWPVDAIFDRSAERSVKRLIVAPIVDALEMGVDSAVFAVGCDGSGKSHTLFQTSDGGLGVAYEVLSGLLKMRKSDASVRELTYSLFTLDNAGGVQDLLDPSNTAARLTTPSLGGSAAASAAASSPKNSAGVAGSPTKEVSYDDYSAELTAFALNARRGRRGTATSIRAPRELLIAGAVEMPLLSESEGVSLISSALARRKAALDALLNPDDGDDDDFDPDAESEESLPPPPPTHTVLRFRVTLDSYDEDAPRMTLNVYVAEVHYEDSAHFESVFETVADGILGPEAFPNPISQLILPKLLDSARANVCHFIACCSGKMHERPLDIRTLRAARHAHELRVERELEGGGFLGDMSMSVLSSCASFMSEDDAELAKSMLYPVEDDDKRYDPNGSTGQLATPAIPYYVQKEIYDKIIATQGVKLGQMEGTLQAKVARKVWLQAHLGRLEYHLELEENRLDDAKTNIVEAEETIEELSTTHPRMQQEAQEALHGACKSVPEKRRAVLDTSHSHTGLQTAEQELEVALNEKHRTQRALEEARAAIRRLATEYNDAGSPDPDPEQIQRELEALAHSIAATVAASEVTEVDRTQKKKPRTNPAHRSTRMHTGQTASAAAAYRKRTVSESPPNVGLEAVRPRRSGGLSSSPGKKLPPGYHGGASTARSESPPGAALDLRARKSGGLAGSFGAASKRTLSYGSCTSSPPELLLDLKATHKDVGAPHRKSRGNGQRPASARRTAGGSPHSTARRSGSPAHSARLSSGGRANRRSVSVSPGALRRALPNHAAVLRTLRPARRNAQRKSHPAPVDPSATTASPAGTSNPRTSSTQPSPTPLEPPPPSGSPRAAKGAIAFKSPRSPLVANGGRTGGKADAKDPDFGTCEVHKVKGVGPCTVCKGTWVSPRAR